MPAPPADKNAAVGNAARASGSSLPSAAASAQLASANLEHDARKVAAATAGDGNGERPPTERALEQVETHVSEEGTKLLEDHLGG